MDPQHNDALINISYWNANSIKDQFHEHYAFMINNNIHISCLQETMLSQNHTTPSHPSFITHRHDRITPDGQRSSGGVAIIIRKNLKHRLLPLPHLHTIEAIGIEVSITNGSVIEFWSVYLPGGTDNQSIRNSFKQDLKKLINRPRSYFICGDFNAKHRYWNCSRANLRGTILFETFTTHDFLINYPSEPSHHPPNPDHLPSTIDLVLTNGLHVASDMISTPAGSDHNIIQFNVDTIHGSIRNGQNKIPLFSKADWELYKRKVDCILSEHTLPSYHSTDDTSTVDNMISTLTNAISTAQKASIPLVKNNPYSLTITPEIQTLIKYRNSWKNYAQRHPHFKTMLNPVVNNLTKTIRVKIDKIRNDNFSLKISQISGEENNKALWQTSKLLMNKNRQIPPLKLNGVTLITQLEKCEALADQFASNHSNNLEFDNVSHTRFVNNSVDRFVRYHDDDSNQPVLANIQEIEKTIRKLKNSKAPGLDSIHNSLVKKLPPIGILWLGLIINLCLKLSYFPSAWKTAKVIGIKKPDKPPDDPGSYRPISLLSSLSKILERIILTRLKKHIADNNVIPPQQHGFREKHSTTTQLFAITSSIKASLHDGLSTGMVLMDIEKAFDRVWHNGLVFKLIATRTPKYLISIIHSFLQNRTFRVHMSNDKSASKDIRFGVPQGAVLSPTLYSIYTHDIPLDTECTTALFADDTAFYTSSRYAKTIMRKLEKTAKTTIRYFTKWKITANCSKTQAIFFTKRRTKQLPTRPLSINNSTIEWLGMVKYLGLHMDKKLTLQRHIRLVSDKASKTVKVLYSLLNRKSRLYVNSKLLLYKAAIRPMMSYAAPIIVNAAKSNLKILQTQQNKILKMILQKPWRTPTTQVQEEANTESMIDYLSKLSENFLAD